MMMQIINSFNLCVTWHSDRGISAMGSFSRRCGVLSTGREFAQSECQCTKKRGCRRQTASTRLGIVGSRQQLVGEPGSLLV